MTRTFKSSLLTEPTRLEIVARSEDRRGVILNGRPYWVKKVDANTYEVTPEGKDGYTVTADDMGGRCDCPAGRHHKHRCCKHLCCVAILRQDVRALAALAVKEVL